MTYKTEKILAEIANQVERDYDALRGLANIGMAELEAQGITPPDYGVALVSIVELAHVIGLEIHSDEFAARICRLMETGKARGMSARKITERNSININMEARRLWKPSDRAGAGRRIVYLEFIPVRRR